MKTDDVLKALEQCVNGGDSCGGCPLIGCFECRSVLLVHALDTINSLKAENASLEAGRRADSESILSLNHELLHVKTEAIKKFAERLCDGRVSNDPVVIAVKRTVKEMTEEQNES